MSRLRNTEEGLPHFLVIGAEKAGTTWLYQALRKHPEIFLPDTKEIHFFNSFNSLLEPVKHFELGIKWYKRFFQKSRIDQVRGEVTPMYLSDPSAAERISLSLPQVRLIYVLREPVSRAYSHYWMARRKGLVSEEFASLIHNRDPRFIGRGYYSEQLTKFHALFDQEQLLGLHFEEFFENKRSGLRKVLQFLHVTADDNTLDDILTASSDFVGEARAPRSVLLHQLISRLSKHLRNTNAGSRTMDLVKRTKVSRLKDINLRREPYDPILAEDRKALMEVYREDILKLQPMVPFSIRGWLS